MKTCPACHQPIRGPEPFRECPSFERCSANICPLDPARNSRTHCPDDPEPKCRARPSVVRDIASGYPEELLPWVSAPLQKSIP
jgi:hypothetical protein